jgi:RNA polymerase sigma factor (sigma-70 family)
MDDDLSDDDALQDIRKGGRRGFVVLYQRYEPDVYTYVISKGVPESDRDDVIQEIFFQFFKTLINNTFKQGCLLSTWLYCIRNKTTCTYWRQAMAQNNLENFPCDEAEEAENNDFCKELSEQQSQQWHNDLECQICIEQILARLEQNDARLSNCLKVLLLHAQGESQKNIARQINKTEEATRKYLSKCVRKLRQYLPLQDCQ